MQRKPYPWTPWHILALDSILLWFSFVVSYYLRYQVQFLRAVEASNEASFIPYLLYAVAYIGMTIFGLHSAQLYVEKRERSLAEELVSIFNATSTATIGVMALSFLLQPEVFSRLLLGQVAVLSTLTLFGARIGLRAVRNRLHRRGVGVENVLLVGVGEVGLYVMRTIVARPNLGYRLVGFLDDDPERGQKDIGRVAALGNLDKLADVLKENSTDLVVVTLPWRAHSRILDVVETCEQQGVNVRVVPDLLQLKTQVDVETLGGLPLIGARKRAQLNRTALVVKRLMDLGLSLLLLPVALPVMAITALLIRLDSPGDIFFYQTRIGLNGKPFRMVKFRSMIPEAEKLQDDVVKRTSDDPEGKLERKEADPRITRIGRFLRRTSLDELPQLFNVLRGEMSLVGPRPALPQEVALYKAWHLQRLMVRPGMTGLWQVSGRSDIPFEEKALLDIYYIENWSLGIDVQILIQTAPQVFLGRGAY